MLEFGLRIGAVDHYYPKAHAAVFKVEDGDIRVGDRVHIVGRGVDVWQRVESIERDHEKVKDARSGWSIGLEVEEPVREDAEIYRFHK